MNDQVVSIAVLAERVRATYFVEPRRMERAVALYEAHSLKKLGKPESIWQVASAQAPKGHWTVDDEKLTCDCPDATKHNTVGLEGTFVCKHIAAVLLQLKVEAETKRQETKLLDMPSTVTVVSGPRAGQQISFDEALQMIFAPLTKETTQ